jgi:GGDEF domain-containing protein
MNPRGAERLARAARAAQSLSETLWEALHEELTDPAARRVAELSQRLADVSATVALLARVNPGESGQGERPPAPARGEGESRVPRAIHDERPTPSEPLAPLESSSPPERAIHDEPPPPHASSAARAPTSPAVLVDELGPPAPAPEAPSETPEPGAQVVREIEIRDERHEVTRSERVHDTSEPDAWVSAIGRRLERYERDRAPFAVLVVELTDVERLRHAELPGEVSRLTGLVEAALSGELRPADSLTRESPGRYWLLAPETDSGGATALAERMASAVRGAASHRGASLEIAVGIAVCPVDGNHAAALAAHADITLYAARSSGKPVA